VGTSAAVPPSSTQRAPGPVYWSRIQKRMRSASSAAFGYSVLSASIVFTVVGSPSRRFHWASGWNSFASASVVMMR